MLLHVAVEPQVCFKRLVRSLRLTICLWVVGCADILAYAQYLAKVSCQIRGESGVAIADDSQGDPIVGEDVFGVELGNAS
jgi:hypothetical protein